jgi:hypothetical protein
MSYKFGSFDTVGAIILALVGFVALVAVVGVLIAFPLMLLWNWLMPTIFHLPEITFLQALGLYFLARAFLGNSVSKKE